ncbi:aspartate aminotransferase family protein [Pedobacter endophyticus]|uniref:Aspartate aminotransferase family protein n=1 Tax=Pedobacter endophyticus TaxID=2789740 RepID=A0A7S9KZH3_9SPHI|nr:aspartate aminotransferase family protein [Pedobacter endophyticus]QPH39691.1 aspartate aminotransferase family protein [Pedobacter endophyticus]
MNKAKSEALLARRRNAVANGVGVFNTATVQSAKGAIIIDVDGNELIDFTGGIGVINAGHCPQPVIDAITQQAQKYIHTSFNVVTYEPYIALCEKLNSIFPHGGKGKTMLVSTGAEAVENAIKIAKQATKRSAVICYTGAFHGRTLMAMTLTSKTSYANGCGPFAPEVYRIDYPDFYKNGAGKAESEFVVNELQKLEEFFKTNVSHQDVAAIIIELVQGEGGFTVAPKAYITGLRKICDKYGIVLIFDEVQTGFGRTAAWGAVEHFDVQPDISTWAKSMGSGLPIGAVIGRQEVMDAAAPGTVGGTYIGNPLACAASLATIKYMEEINLNEKAKNVGNIVSKRFDKLKSQYPQIGEVRGLGAMLAMEFVKNNNPQQPDTELCTKLVEACAEKGLIVISAGLYKNVLRILVPLVISEELLNKGLDIIEGELTKLTA